MRVRHLPKLPRYGYALLAGLSALFMVAVMGMCVVVALVASVQKPTPVPTVVVPTVAAIAATCDDPIAADALWRLEGENCILHEDLVDGSVTHTLDMSYPYALVADYPFIKPIILNGYNADRDWFWQYRAETPHHPDDPTDLVPWEIKSSLETTSFSSDVLSILIRSSSYIGAAHPSSGFETLTFYLPSQASMSLADIFQNGTDPYAVVAPIVRAEIQRRMPGLEDSFILPGTEPTPDNFTNWGLTSDSLILYLGEGQVGGFVSGKQIVTIPLADLADRLKPEFIPAS